MLSVLFTWRRFLIPHTERAYLFSQIDSFFSQSFSSENRKLTEHGYVDVEKADFLR